MKSKVRWTQREFALIAQYFRDNGIDPLLRGFSGALREAQAKVLPPERHRPTVGLAQSIKHSIARAIQNLPTKEVPEPVELRQPQVPTAASLSTEELLVELARRIAPLLTPRSEAQQSVGAQLGCCERPDGVRTSMLFGPHPPHKHNPEPVSDERQRKPRILVCGPNSDLANHLKQTFPNLDLRFIGFQDNPALVASRAQSCDTILVLTKFVNHSTTDAVKHSCTPFRLVTGAKEARAWLSTL